YPKERATGDDLIAALGKHARRVVETVAAGFHLANPMFEFGNFADADAKFDEMKCHDFQELREMTNRHLMIAWPSRELALPGFPQFHAQEKPMSSAVAKVIEITSA